MALQLFSLPNVCSKKIHGQVLCSASTKVGVSQGGRRPPQYQPTLWTYNYLQSLPTRDQRHAVKQQNERVQMLEQEVRSAMNDENAEFSTVLALVDDIQRLGLSFLFDEDVMRALHRYHHSLDEGCMNRDKKTLHGTALCFRILRQNGFEVSQDVFRIFMDEQGTFMESLSHDVEGMLSLYEASHLAFEEEDLLREAKAFAVKHLNHFNSTDVSRDLKYFRVNHGSGLPLHQRMPLLEARRSIKAYAARRDADRRLLELAMYNFNMVQSILQRDLQEMSRWWNDVVSLANKLSFARDRLMECFFWTVGMAYEPQFSNLRKGLTKVTALVTTIDDVYDVYGDLDELELFTDAVHRWDVDAVSNLPGYMKLCFLALYNSVHEMAYDVLKQDGENIIPCLAKAWSDLCKAFMQEAKWKHNKVTPAFKEYMNNGWISVSGLVILIHAFFLLSPHVRKEELESFESYSHDLLKSPSVIFRLCNDLGTSSVSILLLLLLRSLELVSCKRAEHTSTATLGWVDDNCVSYD
ncbi:probable terpene synthase 12 [Syzygium oleosum]|uniref:probable terpene synthase 12 n=1 Tax=Syzygium oleosum TaxID=219896 RepID=UPI0024BA0FA9|nr:probable terpene synthase 12 [Syzygium oleosum]